MANPIAWHIISKRVETHKLRIQPGLGSVCCRYGGSKFVLLTRLPGRHSAKMQKDFDVVFWSVTKCAALSSLLAVLITFGGTTDSLAASSPVLAQNEESVRNEIQHSIDRGLRWLLANQSTNGWWQTPDHPAVTALVLMAFSGDPMDRYRGAKPPQLGSAYEFLTSHVKSDGSICVTNLPTYNTAVSMMALLSAHEPKFEAIILKARTFLVGLQHDFGESGKLDTPFDGGFGYGLPSDTVSDMSNTLLALEALYYSKQLLTDRSLADAKDLNWAAAIHFLESCQNLPQYNKQGWASDDPKERGGFIYHTGRSNAGNETNSLTGRVTWHSYGSISYAGMLSYIYADLRPDDPRVKAVAQWLQQNYTVDENPGMGSSGLYFYYHTMAKALRLAARSDSGLIGSKQASWREDLGLRLIQLQQPDGSWVNNNARWWEKEPALVTAYSVLTLETVCRSMRN
jgi:squalene-hopene/tetraprenyl-beta-curcumene cyclase